jgi:hypothetical protein
MFTAYATADQVPATPTVAHVFATAASVEAVVYVADPQAAVEFAATLPKGIKAKASTLTYGDNRKVGWVSMRAVLEANGVNGGRNETGVKRVQAFRRAMAKAGLRLEFAAVTHGMAGTAQSEGDLDALLGL